MKILIILFVIFSLAGLTQAGDLYHVEINSQNDAEILKAMLPETVAKTNSGYLVIVESKHSRRLANSPLVATFLAGEIARTDISLDRRRDQVNTSKYQTLYENGALRLLRVNANALKSTAIQQDLFSVDDKNIPIDYYPPQYQMLEELSSLQLPLDSLAGLVLEDDLTFDISYLQTLVSRVPGSNANTASRNWLFNRLNALSLDSLYLDTWTEDINGTSTLCHNIVAVKVGTVKPKYQIIVGAHFDSVNGSPGADDNGSGTIAVLKIAEILSQIDTDMTFKFIMYDAEETGLDGSYHHADIVHQNGDSLVLMFNMDMIGAAGNEDTANVYHGTYTDHAEIYEILADSLLDGFIAPPSGPSGRTDHVPYFELGYNVIDLMEYNFSTVYHTPEDNLSNMNMAYMTRMVKGALMTVYAISQTYGPIPIFTFDEPNGPATHINPLVPTSYQFSIESHYGAQPLAGTGQFHYKLIDESNFTALPVTELGGNLYEVDLPILDCYDELNYFVSVDETQTGQLNYPIDTYQRSIIADSTLYPFSDDFTNDLGWVASATGASNALFERSQLPGYAEYWYIPPTDINGDNYCFITGNYSGASYATKGTRSITSPVISMPGDEGYLRFYYFLNSYYDQTYDHLDILVNNGDGNWVKVAEYRQPDTWYQWAPGEVSYETIRNAGVEFTPTMQVRFSAVCDYEGTILECCIDDIKIVSDFCDQIHVHANPSSQLGQPPHDVSFTSQCDYNVSSWLWDFGDGTTSTEEHPSHTYNEPGTYNVRVDVVSDVGDYYTMHEEIVGVYADSMIGQTIQGPPGTIVEMEVYAQNYVPLSEVILPFRYTGDLRLTFRGYNNAGLRSEHMTLDYLNFDSFNKEATIAITAPVDQPLPVGSGPIAKLLFEINTTNELSDSTEIFIGEVKTILPEFNSILGSYDPIITSGFVKAGSCCTGLRGNINFDPEDLIDIEDLVFFVDYQFRNGEEPFCFNEADLDNNGVIDISDLVYMVDYQFRDGADPLSCY